jgi:hypothetical protein
MTEPARPQRLHSRSLKVLDALKDAGIVRDGDYVRRVIIDINVDLPVVVYVERYGDERLLDLVRTLDGAEIHTGTLAEKPSGALAGYRIGGKFYDPADVDAVYREEART